jgi:superfamily II DNA/RNA helicase
MPRRYETVARLRQEYVFVPRHVKETTLVYMLRETLADQTAIIFVSRCRCARRLNSILAPLH